MMENFDLKDVQTVVAVIFLAIGIFFIFTSAVGVIRMPDFYSRLQASGVGDTLGLMSSIIGLAIYEGFSLTSVKLIFIFVFLFFANTIGTHVLSRAAFKSGHKVWRKEYKNETEE